MEVADSWLWKDSVVVGTCEEQSVWMLRHDAVTEALSVPLNSRDTLLVYFQMDATCGASVL